LSRVKRKVRMLVRRPLWTRSYDDLLQRAQPAHDPHLAEVYDARGIAFIHIPKAAGSSVEALLYGYSVRHRTWSEVCALAPDRFDTWLKMAVVREPIDRFLSAFDYVRGGGGNTYNREFGRRFIGGQEVNAFVARLKVDPWFRQAVLRWFHFRPQAEFVQASGGEIMVNRLIAAERLDLDLPPLAGVARTVPVLNRTPGARTSRTELTADSLVALSRIYRVDAGLHRLALSDGSDLFGRVAPN
jgi:hypothetical protein